MQVAASPQLYRRTAPTIEQTASGDDRERYLSLNPTGILFLQQSIGNAAVSTIIQRSQDDAAPEGGLRPPLALLVQRDVLHGTPGKTRSATEIEGNARPLADSMGQQLDHWKNQAYWGIQNFVNEELEKRIDTMRKAGLTTASFLQSLAGNVIWAAACFVPESKIFAFIISLAGIEVAAQASGPTASAPADEGVVSGLAEEVQGYLDKIEEDLRGKSDSRLLDQAKDLVSLHEELSQPELLELFMKATFTEPMLTPGVGGKLIRFNDDAVRKGQKEALKTRLQHFMDVVPLVGTKTEAESVAGHKIGGEHTLSLVAVSEPGSKGRPDQVRWGIGYETKHRETDSHGTVVTPGAVVIAKWAPNDVVNDVLRRESKLKMPEQKLKINASPAEVVMGPEEFADREKELRERWKYSRAG